MYVNGLRSTLGTKFHRIFCAGIGPLLLGVVLVIFMIYLLSINLNERDTGHYWRLLVRQTGLGLFLPGSTQTHGFPEPLARQSLVPQSTIPAITVVLVQALFRPSLKTRLGVNFMCS